ncbi:hypothetical protein, partial [Vibrio parahaemolyticus]
NSISSYIDLYINIDSASKETDIKKVKEVKDIVYNFRGFKSITVNEAKVNLGVDNSVISYVSEVLESHDRVIVLEDDHLTNESFLEYMNAALDFYENDDRIEGISGFSPPLNWSNLNTSNDIYFAPRGSSWGWATWRKRWNAIDWEMKKYPEYKSCKNNYAHFSDGGNDLPLMLKTAMELEVTPYWDIRRCFHMMLERSYFVYPRFSYVKNIGLDGTGLHCGESERYMVSLKKEAIGLPNFKSFKIDDDVLTEFRKVHQINLFKAHIGFLLRKLHLK